MDAITLMERLGGEILNNKIRVTVNGEVVVAARLIDQDWQYTDAGQLLANEHSNLAVDEATDEAAAPKTRKKGLAAVESEQAPAAEEPAAEEQAPAAE